MYLQSNIYIIDNGILSIYKSKVHCYSLRWNANCILVREVKGRGRDGGREKRVCYCRLMGGGGEGKRGKTKRQTR